MRKLVLTVMLAGAYALGAAAVATAQPEKSLDKCQQAAGKVIGKYAAELHKTVTKCLNAISKERVKNATGSSAAAAPKCVSAFRKIINSIDDQKQLDTKAFNKMSKACDPSFNPDLLHVTDDFVDGDNSGGASVSGDALHAERLGMSCGVGAKYQGDGPGGRLSAPLQWFDCSIVIAEQGALRQVHLQYPQGDVWLRDIRPTINAMALLGDLAAADAVDVLDYVRRWVDSGSGTAYDRVTGLTWEKKTDDSSIHDKDNAYSWSTGSPYGPTGTAFTTFLNTLNGGATGVGNCVSSDGITSTGGFAGHCDWRLPTIAELQTILLEPLPCSTSPCVDQSVFGPTHTSNYWSATADAGNPVVAWKVIFANGSVFNDFGKTVSLRVRAVRGGL